MAQGLVCDGITDNAPALQAMLDNARGELVLTAAGVCVLNKNVLVTGNNLSVHGSWSLVLQKGATLKGIMLNVQGNGVRISDLTLDGNGSVNLDGGAVLRLSGANDVAEHLSVLNAAGKGISMWGQHGRASNNTIVGLSNPLVQSYGIWALNGATSIIERNTISGSGIDGIGANGNGTIISGNYLSGNHCYTGMSGGQLALYRLQPNTGIVVSGNAVDVGCSSFARGIEIDSIGAVVTGNYVVGGIVQDLAASGAVLSGNSP